VVPAQRPASGCVISAAQGVAQRCVARQVVSSSSSSSGASRLWLSHHSSSSSNSSSSASRLLLCHQGSMAGCGRGGHTRAAPAAVPLACCCPTMASGQHWAWHDGTLGRAAAAAAGPLPCCCAIRVVKGVAGETYAQGSSSSASALLLRHQGNAGQCRRSYHQDSAWRRGWQGTASRCLSKS
jgi:hypothetical protein